MNDVFSAPDRPYFLYADDDEDDLMLLRDTLKEIDPTVSMYVYKSGVQLFEALESISGGKRLPDLVIVDLNMPQWSGLETLEAIKKKNSYRDIPVIIFSNSDLLKHKSLSLEKGAALFITKPYSAKDLRTTCLRFINYLDGPGQFK